MIARKRSVVAKLSLGQEMHSMKLSEVHCVPLVFFSVFPYTLESRKKPYILAAILQQLIGLKVWWPEELVDGEKPASDIRRDADVQYVKDFQTFADEYVRTADELITENPNTGKELDKPNQHGPQELYFHIIPSYGHARQFMELVFECAHATIKRYVSRSNNHNVHIAAVEHGLGNDWLSRLALLQYYMSDRNAVVQIYWSRGLGRLLTGPGMDCVSETGEAFTDFSKEVDKSITEAFVVPRELCADGNVCAECVGVSVAWVAGEIAVCQRATGR